MAFQKVAGARKYFKYAECEQGQRLVVEGLYVGPEQGKYGVQHVFKQKDKEVVVLNSSGHLNWLLENYASAGTSLCNVIYDGKTVLDKGPMKGKEAHRFELEIDDTVYKTVASERVIDTSTPDISLQRWQKLKK